MDAIEIFFAFYGVLLALAVARLMAGAARLIRHRSTIRIGWATPLLMLLLLFDLSSFVTAAWRTMGVAETRQALVFVCTAAACAYYVAATLATPETIVDGLDLDAWYDTHKRWSVGALLVANLLGVELAQVIATGSAEVMKAHWTGLSLVMNLAFYTLVVVLFLIRNRATNIIMLATLNALYFTVLAAF